MIFLTPIRSFILSLLAVLLIVPKAKSQSDQAIFFEVTGKKLKKPSYLLGTFHLLSNEYVDSFPVIAEKLMKCKHMAGEIDLADTSMMLKMMSASLLEGQTLQDLMSPAQYDSLSAYVREQTGLSLDLFKALKPIAVSVTLTAMAQQKLNAKPRASAAASMDGYLQTMARNAGKKVHGLEQVDDQIAVLYKRISLERQTEMLLKTMRDRDDLVAKMREMNQMYRARDLVALEKKMYDGDFNDKEAQMLLDQRNLNWMEKIPGLMKDGGVFIAVGALHLAGETGLVHQLRKMGYEVRAIAL